MNVLHRPVTSTADSGRRLSVRDCCCESKYEVSYAFANLPVKGVDGVSIAAQNQTAVNFSLAP